MSDFRFKWKYETFTLQLYLLITAILYFPVDGASDGDVRLNGGGTIGRIEVYYNNQWGVVCKDHFNPNIAKVVCRELNLPTNPVQAQSYIQSSMPVSLHYITCLGSESKITDCTIPHYGLAGNDTCSQNLDAGVECGDPTTSAPSTTTAIVDGSVRLVSSTSTSGRLELVRSGSWGTICASEFGLNEARVACRHLGKLHDKVTVKTPAYYGQGTGPIWKLKCAGNETAVTACKVSAGSGICSAHDQDVGIICGHDENDLPKLTSSEPKASGFDYFYFVIPVVVSCAIAWLVYFRCNRKARQRRQTQNGQMIHIDEYGRARNTLQERERQIKIQNQMRVRNQRAMENRNGQVNDGLMNDPWAPNPTYNNMQYRGASGEGFMTPIENSGFGEPTGIFATNASGTINAQGQTRDTQHVLSPTSGESTTPQKRFFQYPQQQQQQPRLPAYATEFDSPYPPSYDDIFGNGATGTNNQSSTPSTNQTGVATNNNQSDTADTNV